MRDPERERERERGREGESQRVRDIGRRRSRLHAGSPMQDSILGPRDHALSQGRCSTTEPPGSPKTSGSVE